MLLTDTDWASSKGRRVRRVAAHLSAPVQGETVLLHAQTGHYFGLNNTGSRVWDMVAEEKTLESIAESLLSEFEVERELLQQDLLRIVSEMEAAGLVQVIEER